MKKPFFSVLIPTKNRSHIVGYAIQSVLEQSHSDFEIILVDNDDTEKTQEAVKRFSDPRIRYFKTGGLNMCENWEYALMQAQGRYITVLEDKQAYYDFALKKIYSTITSEGVDLVTWGWDVYDDQVKLAYKTSLERGVVKLTSDFVLHKYTTSIDGVWELLPRMLNSCVSHEIVEKIKSHPQVDKFFSEVSPDLCAAFYTLSEIDELCFIKERLGLVGYLDLSNANMIRDKKSFGLSYFGKGDFAGMLTDYVPVKEYKLTHNTIYNDYLRIREKKSGRLSKYQMTPYIYAKTCLSDLVMVPFLIKSSAVSIIAFIRDNELPMLSLSMFFMRNLVDRFLVRHIDKYNWLKKINIIRKKKTWKADNILLATRSPLSTGS